MYQLRLVARAVQRACGGGRGGGVEGAQTPKRQRFVSNILKVTIEIIKTPRISERVTLTLLPSPPTPEPYPHAPKDPPPSPFTSETLSVECGGYLRFYNFWK